MASAKFALHEFPWDERYRVRDLENLLTPALIVYSDAVAANIDCTLNRLEGNTDRWRVHIKTAKLAYTLRMLIDRGVRNFKCATTLELLTACRQGAADVLVAYPVMGANARRVAEICAAFPSVRISVLAESESHVRQWQGTSIGIFIDINPGMNRTGIGQDRKDEVVNLLRLIVGTGVTFRGLHYYDGQYGAVADPERTAAAHAGYDRLLELVREISRQGFAVPELITAGTSTLPCSLSYEGFLAPDFIHRVSPGTVVYSDATSLAQLPNEYGHRPAALVLARVVSRPGDRILTCDAGHKSVSADAGVPTCVVVGHPTLAPLSPSEEHLPIQARHPSQMPKVGDSLYLLPRHICPTVNNFDSALIVRDGRIQSIEPVSARGHEAAVLHSVPV